jgi:hypothetical protein
MIAFLLSIVNRVPVRRPRSVWLPFREPQITLQFGLLDIMIAAQPDCPNLLVGDEFV